MVGLTPINITDVEQAGDVRVGIEAAPLEPPDDSVESWVIDSDSTSVSLGAETVTIAATVVPETDAITPGPAVSTQTKWIGIIDATVVADVTTRDQLVVELSVDGASQTVQSEPFDLERLDDSFDKPEVDQDTQADFTAGDLPEIGPGSITTERAESTLPDSIWQGKSGLTPKLQARDDDGTVIAEFEPIAVTRLGGTLPWDTESTQLQCGATVTDANGDMNVRLVYHAICTKTQFDTLVNGMRGVPNNIKLISHAYNGRATFDQLKFDRVTDANGAISASNGRIEEPIYKVQLQSKEESGN